MKISIDVNQTKHLLYFWKYGSNFTYNNSVLSIVCYKITRNMYNIEKSNCCRNAYQYATYFD